jgi:hypothetical protein
MMLTQSAYSQAVRSWFTDQPLSGGSKYAVGYAERSYYKDTSALKNAFLNACLNYTIEMNVRILGASAYWSTENGTYSMGSNVHEEFDTTSVEKAANDMKIIDTLFYDKFLVVLIGNSAPSSDETWFKESQYLSEKPAWIETLPGGDNFYYSLGSAPVYYYESNSWLEAECRARKALAQMVCSKTMEIEKQLDQSGEQIKNEEVSVGLKNLEIVHRWKDSKERICHVLYRMPK